MSTEKKQELSNINTQIREAADEIVELLQSKNASYGDSLSNPLSIFSSEQNLKNLARRQYGICCRIDDKLARIATVGLNQDTLDTLDDVIGYLIRLKLTFRKN
jgi:hypothetical protein